MISRRDFMVSGIAAAGVGIIVPPVFAKSVFAATMEDVHNDRVLVILQLGGGNDGLNTVVPHTDPAYLQVRPTIGIPADKVLPLTAEIGLNPVMPGMKKLFDAGELALVQGVGYPNPVYSHFESLYIWEHADPTMQQSEGSLGKLLAGQLDIQGHPLTGCALGQASTPAELLAQNATVSIINSIPTYQVQGGDARRAAAPALYKRTPGIYGALYDQALSTAEYGIGALANSQSRYKPSVSYTSQSTVYGSKKHPGDVAAADCGDDRDPAEREDLSRRARWVRYPSGRGRASRTRCSPTSTAPSAHSCRTSPTTGSQMRVVLMTWSEFGRRIAENGGHGTDHGAAAPIFVVGKPVKGGIFGEQPWASTVNSGNLQYNIDFRSIYQTLIRDWLQADPVSVLGASFPEVPFIRTV